MGVLGSIFRFMGLGWFLSILTQILLIHHKLHQPEKPIWPHPVCEFEVYQSERAVPSSLVCLCHGSVYCASMCASMPVCQKCASMPEGHSRSVWASLKVPEGPRCPEGQDIVPLCQMAQKPTRLYLWHNFYLKWWYLLV